MAYLMGPPREERWAERAGKGASPSANSAPAGSTGPPSEGASEELSDCASEEQEAEAAEDLDPEEPELEEKDEPEIELVEESVPAVSSTAVPVAEFEPAASKKRGTVLFNASHSDYEVVAAAAEERGWKVVKAEEKTALCNIHWVDDGSIGDWLKKVEPWMRINHFPGMNNALARKTRLARNMARMQKLFPAEYRFIPPTWVLPDDINDLERRFGDSQESKVIYIVKPDHLCQGKGIFLTTELDRLRKVAQESREKDQSAVVQRYIMRPMLIDGLKFDLRLYFLVCAKTAGEVLDLRCFLFRDGLVRLCTTAYSAPTPDTMNEKCMHLTNYAVNKLSNNFQQNTSAEDDGSGSKRSLRWFLNYVEEQYGEKERKKLWAKLMGLCVKTLLTVQPTLEAEYSGSFPRDLAGGKMGCRCFEVLGIDVMLDAKRKPYLIEVNHLPSFTCDSPLDEDIKRRLIDQTLDITCGTIGVKDKKLYEQLVRDRRGNSGTAALPSAVEQLSAADAAALAAIEAGTAIMDVASYKDFERAFPLPASMPKLAAQCNTILQRVRELFKPVHAVRKRSDSKELQALQRPPLPPKSAAVAPKEVPRAPGMTSRSLGDEEDGLKRSHSAPGPPRCALPPLHRAPSTSTRKSHSSRHEKTPSHGASQRALSARKAVAPPRASLPMKSIQITL